MFFDFDFTIDENNFVVFHGLKLFKKKDILNILKGDTYLSFNIDFQRKPKYKINVQNKYEKEVDGCYGYSIKLKHNPRSDYIEKGFTRISFSFCIMLNGEDDGKEEGLIILM